MFPIHIIPIVSLANCLPSQGARDCCRTRWVKINDQRICLLCDPDDPDTGWYRLYGSMIQIALMRDRAGAWSINQMVRRVLIHWPLEFWCNVWTRWGLQCSAKQYLLTRRVSRYCLLTLLFSVIRTRHHSDTGLQTQIILFRRPAEWTAGGGHPSKDDHSIFGLLSQM